MWSKDGKTLYYLDAFRRMTAVEIAAVNDSVRISAARTLFPSSIRHSIPVEAYDVSRDNRFLVVDSITESAAPVVLVTNWDTDLKK